jgi:hypothetical protein
MAVVGDFKITEPLSNPVHGPPKQFLNITEDGEILDGGDGDLPPFTVPLISRFTGHLYLSFVSEVLFSALSSREAKR